MWGLRKGWNKEKKVTNRDNPRNLWIKPKEVVMGSGQRFVWVVFLLAVVTFVSVWKVQAAEKITLPKGCYTCRPSPTRGDENVLTDGKKQSSYYVEVAGWKTWEPVEIIFNLGKNYPIDRVKLYSTNNTDGKIGVVTLYASQNGQIYTAIGKADNSKAPLNYPETAVIEIKANGEEAKFVKIKYVASGGRITQLGEVEIFAGAGATLEKKSIVGGETAAPGEVYREDFETGEARGWEVEANYLDGLVMGIVEGGAEGSKYAYEIRRDSGKTDTMFRWISPHIAIKGGKGYQLVMDQKNTYDTSKLAGKKGTQILWYDSERKEIPSEEKITGFGSPDPNWHEVKSPVFAAPANAAFARIRLGVDWRDFFGGLYWRVDNIRLIEK